MKPSSLTTRNNNPRMPPSSDIMTIGIIVSSSNNSNETDEDADASKSSNAAAADCDCPSAAAAAALSSSFHSESQSQDNVTTASSSSATETTTTTTTQQQQQQQLQSKATAAAAATRSSYFDNNNNNNNGYFDNASVVGGVGEWMSDTVQSAVTRFFGGDGEEEEGTPTTTRAAGEIEDRSQRQRQRQQHPLALESPSAASAMTRGLDRRSPQNSTGAAACALGDVRYEAANGEAANTAENNDATFQILRRARSMSPSFNQLFASNSGCSIGGVYSHLNDRLLQCDSTTNSNNNNNNQHDEGQETPVAANYQPYFAPADFSPSAWLSVLNEPHAYYCGAGAGVVLTAVIVIHPLALFGAAVSAVGAAGAMWAVGFFHQVDKGYQIWNEDFGLLFWEDNNDAQGTAGDDGESKVAGQTIAATVTYESHAIIQKDEEHLQRVFLLEQDLLEQEQLQLAENAKVAEIDEESIQLLHDEKSDTGSSAVETEEERATDDERLSKSSKNIGGRLRSKQQLHPRKEYLLRRIKSAPVKVLERPSIRRKGKKRQPKTRITVTDSSSSKPSTATATQQATIEASTASPFTQIIEPHPEEIPQATSLPAKIEKLDSQTAIDSHFPPLEICVIRRKELPGLNTSEFFKVFFADDAPYSFKDFQKRRGDVDIVYGGWEPCVVEDGEDLYSFREADGDNVDLPSPLPSHSSRQRLLKFNTLTKSYFGPAYAKATKTQRATQLSSHVLVIENVTQLSDIPFSDRFRVMERWVIEAVRNNDHGKSDNDCQSQQRQKPNEDPAPLTDSHDHAMEDAQYTCHLSISGEVQMLKPCSWESQIRKKASETFTQVAKEWCKTATAALKAAEDQKKKRLESRGDFLDIVGNGSSFSIDDTADCSTTAAMNKEMPILLPPPPPLMIQPPPSSSSSSSQLSPPLTSPSARESELFAKHQRNFQHLDKLIAAGDFEEYCSVEVMHSLGAGRRAAYAKVLENPSSSSSEPSALLLEEVGNDVDIAGGEIMMDGSRRKAAGTSAVMMRRKSRKLFKKLSSRVGAGNKLKQQH